jgi:hypothetical protein
MSSISQAAAGLKLIPGTLENHIHVVLDCFAYFSCPSTLNAEGTSYGPPFGAVDAIGCLLNQVD